MARPAINGFCKRDAVDQHGDTLMFSTEGRDYAVITDTPIMGNGVFMIVTDEEWEAHRIISRPTIIE